MNGLEYADRGALRRDKQQNESESAYEDGNIPEPKRDNVGAFGQIARCRVHGLAVDPQYDPSSLPSRLKHAAFRAD